MFEIPNVALHRKTGQLSLRKWPYFFTAIPNVSKNKQASNLPIFHAAVHLSSKSKP